MVVALTGALLALAALVLSLTGVATGLPGKNRIDRNDLRKRVVRGINVQKNAIRRFQLAPSSVGGLHVRENTLGQVPNAKTVDGHEIHNTGRVVVNDAIPGDNDTTVVELFTAGTFTIRGHCAEDRNGTGTDGAYAIVSGPPGTSFVGRLSDGTAVATPDSTFGSLTISAVDTGSEVRGGHVTAVAPNGDVLSISTSAEVGDPVGGCVFGVTAVGP